MVEHFILVINEWTNERFLEKQVGKYVYSRRYIRTYMLVYEIGGKK